MCLHLVDGRGRGECVKGDLVDLQLCRLAVAS